MTDADKSGDADRPVEADKPAPTEAPTTWYPTPPAADMHRRMFLQGAGAGSALLFGAKGAQAQSARDALSAYKRAFFTDAEWAFVLAATSRLIPSNGDGPGALEAHVPIFIDMQMSGDFGAGADWYMQGPHDPKAPAALGFQSPLTPAQIYRGAIAAVDAWCKAQNGKAFADLDAGAQDEALKAVEAGRVGLGPELRDFFSLFLQNTKEGYFSDPMYGGNYKMAAWKYIGFPGARGNFREWVDKPNVAYPLGPVSINGDRG